MVDGCMVWHHALKMGPIPSSPLPPRLLQELKRRKKNVETLAVLKNGVHFTTPELKELGFRYKEARREYEEKQSGLVEKAVETAATYLPLVESASGLVSACIGSLQQ